MATTSRALRTINSISRENLFPALWALPNWVHPEVVYNYLDWKQVRDCIAGEKEIKAENIRYLPMMESMTEAEYLSYLDRATYYNFSGQTLQALNGTIFRRKPVLSDVPARLEANLARVTIDDQDFETYSRAVSNELLALSRVGVLLDLDDTPTTTPEPYFVTYTAEHILDWEVAKNTKTGRNELVKVVLREVTLSTGDAGTRKYVASYRVLTLENGVYYHAVYADTNADADLDEASLVRKFAPERAGTPLSFIPFILFTPTMGTYGVEKPMMLDITGLNVSHYRSYAHLEQGRFFTGFPVYYAELPQGSEGNIEYELAPWRVWEVPAGSKPGLLEFYGQGLAFLEKALDTKEHQAAALGGRIIGIRSGAGSESTQSAKMQQLNEHAMLLTAAASLDFGFTKLLRWWAWWSGIEKTAADKITAEFNKDFLFSDIGSREFRAIHALYKDGIIPIDVVYTYLKKALVIPDWMNMEEFRKLLDKMESFPNQPNVEAMMSGFPDKKTELEQENREDDQEHEAEMAEKAAETAVEAAAARPAPGNAGPPGGPGAPGRPGGGTRGRPPANRNAPAKTG